MPDEYYVFRHLNSPGVFAVATDAPDFWAELIDAGSGAVNTTLTAGSGSATFTRATTAWTKLSTGLWAQVSSGTARSYYIGRNTAVGAYCGYLSEGARTNRCLQARDLSNASWTKTSASAVKNATGIDGTGSSAATLTASGANGTCLQAITDASAGRIFSAFVRRKTGTGSVFITLDNDATRTDITSSINSTTYTQVSMAQTLANPTVGFKLATSGDEIEVDMCQEETGTFASTPIPTTTASVTRNAEALSYPSSGNYDSTQGSAFAAIESPIDDFYMISQSSNIANGVMIKRNSFHVSLIDDVATRSFGGLSGSPISGVHKFATSWGGSASAGFFDGAKTGTDTFSGNMPAPAAKIQLGLLEDANLIGHSWGGTKDVRIWKTTKSDAFLQSLTT